MENSWKKPAVSIKAPRPASSAGSEEAKDVRDEMEVQAAQQKQQATRDADKVGKLLNANYYLTDWTFPFLRNAFNQSMSVSRFYPQAAVAVDIFTHITQHEETVIALKRKLFNENAAIVEGKETKVRYGALDWSMPLADLLPQIGEAEKAVE